LARPVALVLIFRFEGYFHTNGILPYTGFDEVKAKLEAIPQNQPLPIILYEKLSGDPLPTFNGPLVQAYRPGNGFGAHFVLKRSELTKMMLVQNWEYSLFAPEDKVLLEKYQKATEISDELTRWLRGGRGWLGFKPNFAVHDVLLDREPQWRRKPLTPQMLEAKT